MADSDTYNPPEDPGVYQSVKSMRFIEMHDPGLTETLDILIDTFSSSNNALFAKLIYFIRDTERLAREDVKAAQYFITNFKALGRVLKSLDKISNLPGGR